MVKDEESGEEKEVVRTIEKMVDKEIEIDTTSFSGDDGSRSGFGRENHQTSG